MGVVIKLLLSVHLQLLYTCMCVFMIIRNIVENKREKV